MLDYENDIKIYIKLSTRGRNRATANVVICDLFQINNFEIIQAQSNKLYVINPHVIKMGYNNGDEKTVNYYNTACLLPHKDRKKIADMILEAYARKLDELHHEILKTTDTDIVGLYNERTWHTFKMKEEEGE